MLKEFIELQQSLPPIESLPLKGCIRCYTNRAFSSGLDVLKDPDRFPNKPINDLTAQLEELIVNDDVGYLLLNEIPDLSFLIARRDEGMNELAAPVIALPADTYLDQVRENPVNELVRIASIASQCRDFICGIYGSRAERRSQAYAAEAFLTVVRINISEEVTIDWPSYMAGVVRENPQGLKSLPPECRHNFSNN